jgi:hypothetical protein
LIDRKPVARQAAVRRIAAPRGLRHGHIERGFEVVSEAPLEFVAPAK